MSESETLATFWTVISGLIKTSIRLVRTAFRMLEKLEDSYLKGKLVHAFIEISLDYCGAPFAGLSQIISRPTLVVFKMKQQSPYRYAQI